MNLRILIAATFALSSTHCFETSAAEAPSPLEQSVKIYNSLQSANRLFAFMKVGMNPKDAKYLDGLAKELAGEAIPIAYVKGDSLTFQGFDKPFKVLDVQKKIYSYDGKKLELSFNGGLEPAMASLKQTLFPNKTSLFDFILPQAHAAMDSKTMMTMMSGLMAVGGLGMIMSCMGSKTQSTSNSMLCGMGGFMGGLGVVGLIMGLSKDDKPEEVKCSVDSSGMRRVVILGQNGAPLTSVVQYPGQSQYSIMPAVREVPQANAQYGASQLMTICNRPQQLGSINSALAQPVFVSQAQPQMFMQYSNVAARPVILMPQSKAVTRGVSSVPLAPQSLDLSGGSAHFGNAAR